ncbi:hypothetical protein [Cupriavidus sp. BIS7]|uniref:hypothetical protein n=1 Tax=Cupriavidus sp. BIS7 TaxID=1217718 RepID=UPI0012F6F36D|nr:hypothetical protein [Cupriavidus sp. BIS7]
MKRFLIVIIFLFVAVEARSEMPKVISYKEDGAGGRIELLDKAIPAKNCGLPGDGYLLMARSWDRQGITLHGCWYWGGGDTITAYWMTQSGSIAERTYRSSDFEPTKSDTTRSN